jgi:apolipoprotein N-acyltransferase
MENVRIADDGPGIVWPSAALELAPRRLPNNKAFVTAFAKHYSIAALIVAMKRHKKPKN